MRYIQDGRIYLAGSEGEVPAGVNLDRDFVQLPAVEFEIVNIARGVVHVFKLDAMGKRRAFGAGVIWRELFRLFGVADRTRSFQGIQGRWQRLNAQSPVCLISLWRRLSRYRQVGFHRNESEWGNSI